MECNRRRQTTTDAREQNNTAPTLCVGEQVIMLTYAKRLTSVEACNEEKFDAAVRCGVNDRDGFGIRIKVKPKS